MSTLVLLPGGPVNGCSHTRTHHHGTPAAYKRCGCRCQSCLRAARVANKHNRGGGSYRSDPLVDPQATSERVGQLLDAGMTKEHLASLLGVSVGRVQQLRYPRPGAHVLLSTQRRVMAVRVGAPLPAPRPAGLVDATGTRRRLQALMAVGWPAAAVAQETGVCQPHLHSIRVGTITQVQASTAAAVKAATRRRMLLPPPTGRGPSSSRTKAARLGYVPLCAWADDDAVDDPAASPEPRALWARAGVSA